MTAWPDDCLPCEEKSGRTARRKRMEIRRFKLIANSSGLVVAEPSSSSNKRLKPAAANSTTTGAAHCHVARDSTNAFQNFSASLQSPGGLPSDVSAEAEKEDDGIIDGQESRQCAEEPPQRSISSASLCSPSRMDDGERCPPHGVVSVCGRRREMEDALTVMPAFLQMHDSPGTHGAGRGICDVYHFFGVFDGHGGSQAALYCRDRLHEVLAEEARLIDPRTEAGWKKAMSTCFLKMDREVGGLCCINKCQVNCQNSVCVEAKTPGTVGSTAVVAVVGSNQIIVANCGDSRAVLSTAGKAIPLSTDHKPDRADEMVRIEAAGGRVIYWNGYRVLGVLAMSRAIDIRDVARDRYLKPYVIAEPDLTITQRKDEDECLIVASDGLWDVISNELACEIARKCLGFGCTKKSGINEHKASCSDPEIESPPAAAAALLTKLALARGSSDNISVVVVDLKNSRTDYA